MLHVHCLLTWDRGCSGEKWEEKGFIWDCLSLSRHSAWTETPAQTQKGRSWFVLSLALPCLAHQKCWAVGIALVMLVLLPLQLPLPQPYCRSTWSWQGHGRLGQSDLLSQALMAGQLSSGLVSPSFPGTTCTVGVVFVCSTGATGRKMVPPETEITL